MDAMPKAEVSVGVDSIRHGLSDARSTLARKTSVHGGKELIGLRRSHTPILPG